MTFKSAIDTWFYVLALGLPVVLIGTILASLEVHDLPAILVIAVVALISLGLPVWLMLSTRYVIQDGTLRVRSGPFRWTIPLREIRSVEPSRSVLSSPALSLDRLKIRYGAGRSLLVSPRDVEGFRQALGRPASRD